MKKLLQKYFPVWFGPEITPEMMREIQLQQAKIDLVTWQANQDLANANVLLLKKKIDRLKKELKCAHAQR